MSDIRDPIQRPHDREKALSAAYLRLTGATQAEAALATGIAPRTLGRWEGSSWWPAVQREAADRWLAGLAAKARRGLETAVAEDGRLALSVLERIEPALAPARLRTTVETEGETNLLANPFWRFVLSLHVYKGISIAEAQMCARRDPEAVKAWAEAHGLVAIGAGDGLHRGSVADP